MALVLFVGAALSSATARGQYIYVANENSGTIGEYTTSGAVVNTSLVSGLDIPKSITLSGSNLFVANIMGPIGEYTTSGAVVNASLITNAMGLDDPNGPFLSGSNLLVANWGNGTICEYTMSGAVVNASLVSGLNLPWGIVVAGSNLFVSNNGSNTIGEYDATSGAVVNASLVSGLNAPTGIALPTPAPVGLPTLALSGSVVTLRAIRNSGTRTTLTLRETSSLATAGFSSSLGGVATVSPASGVVAAGGAQSLSFGWNSYATTGPLTGTVTLSNTSNPADPFNSSNNVISMSGAVVDNRIVSASNVNFGLFHVGGANMATGTSTLSTTGADGYFTRVTVATTGGTGNVLVTGGTGTLFNSAASSGSRTLSGPLPPPATTAAA